MYSDKTRQIQLNHSSQKRVVPKFSNAQIPRTKISIGYTPVNNKTNIRAELAKEGKIEELSHKSGRKSYAEKARTLDVYDEITEFLSNLRAENTYLTYQNIRDAVVEAFPEVFGGASKYGSNVYRLIIEEDDWKEALLLDKTFVKEVILGNTVQRALKGVREEIDKDGKIYEVGMKDADTIKLIQVLDTLEQSDKKVELEKLQIDYMKNKNRLLEAQIKQLESGEADDSYISGFLKDLDQLDKE